VVTITHASLMIWGWSDLHCFTCWSFEGHNGRQPQWTVACCSFNTQYATLFSLLSSCSVLPLLWLLSFAW